MLGRVRAALPGVTAVSWLSVSEFTNISLSRGAPSLDIIAVDELRAAALRAFEHDAAGTFAYGTSAGYPRLLEWLAKKHDVEPTRLLATNGSMQADAFLFEELVEPGDLVVVEAPTYDRTLTALRKLDARILAIPLQADGIDVGALSRALEAGARPKLAHIIPNFQNPAGCTLSLDKRHKLLDLAREYGFLIFEDDPYVELRFEGEQHPTMLELDEGGESVVYASSFSKTVCPGIRVGYLVGPPGLIASLRRRATETYISPNMVAQSIVADFCHSGAIERSVATVKEALRERRDATCEALGRHLPEARFVTPEGGYFLWVDLPEGSDVAALERGAAERGVVFVKGTDFLLKGGDNSLRLAYSAVPPDQIEEGIARVGEAYRELSPTAA
jgi:2-aminoadipate transaminase